MGRRYSMTPEQEIQAMVDRETLAWDTQDLDLLISIFHPDMVWPWPPDAQSHDPLDWVIEWGRYDYDRWRAGWADLFARHQLVHNVRQTRRVAVSQAGDGAFAVVDVDTLWRNRDGSGDFRWLGRACKIYTKLKSEPREWKMIAQTGLLEYPMKRDGG